MTDEITKATMIAMLARWQVAYVEKQAQEAKAKEAEKKAYEFGRIINDCKNLTKSVGFDREDKDSWEKVPAEFYEGAKVLYDAVRAQNPELPEWNPVRKRDPDPELEAEFDIEDGQPEPEVPGRPPVRMIVLDRLGAALPNGLKAADIRRYIDDTYKSEVHDKTVGMTLYRLLKDGLARREGHTWFSVPPESKTKIPGVGAPGLVETKE